eukprot:m.177739 g.177739  ORF g.177739 m.177739 type:complete len:111 (-) comp53378_c0_seq4:1310-1642(-)
MQVSRVSTVAYGQAMPRHHKGSKHTQASLEKAATTRTRILRVVASCQSLQSACAVVPALCAAAQKHDCWQKLARVSSHLLCLQASSLKRILSLCFQTFALQELPLQSQTL